MAFQRVSDFPRPSEKQGYDGDSTVFRQSNSNKSRPVVSLIQENMIVENALLEIRRLSNLSVHKVSFKEIKLCFKTIPVNVLNNENFWKNKCIKEFPGLYDWVENFNTEFPGHYILKPKYKSWLTTYKVNQLMDRLTLYFLMGRGID